MLELLIMSPVIVKEPSACLVYFHGGGFVFEASPAHYELCREYTNSLGIKTVFVRYRLAPDYPFPFPQEDCFSAYEWVCRNAEKLGIDPEKTAVGGDSAGGALAVTTCLLSKERKHPQMPLFMLLIYPWLDARNESGSARRFTDTPMWNSTLSQKVTPLTDPHPERIPLMLRSPIEAESFSGMPPAYIEIAEYDCLRDDGKEMHRILQSEGVDSILVESEGTMHGFDNKTKAPTTRKMMQSRIAYMKERFDI